ncbi:hypothetical protein K9N68_18395 [Kovacikia minuta CCNUW1]|uniref:hypothetical protein n=1 Tax=Kovacikia minuta TaxID=2931930 RepID=UPI001CCCB274|nr:hypothetical protein [Kovacikia minuta]UBF23734.1 hypothetical protein K9N68_18395 [Kovacikia minuta CCNUW1]
MSLPFVIDVAIGLLFIYLILSLLASELQELLTTLLQWRAKHLKDAIEVLLAGGVDTKDQEQIKGLVDKLYNDPLLKNMNQEAKGLISGGIREVTRWIIPGNRKGAFGRNRSTGPSYIAPETFATSLMNSLGLTVLADKLTEVRLEKFAARIVGTYTPQEQGSPEIPGDESLRDDWERGGIRLLAERIGIRNLNADQKFKTLVEDYDDVIKDYKQGQADLETCIARMGKDLDEYIEACANAEPSELIIDSGEPGNETDYANRKTYFIRRLKSFKLGLFGETNERAIMSGGLRPNAYEVAGIANQGSKIYKELADAYDALKTRAAAIAEKIHTEIAIQQKVATQLEKENKAMRELAEEERRSYVESAAAELANLSEEERRAYVETTLEEFKRLTNEQRQLSLNQALANLINVGDLTYDDRKTYENYQTYQEFKQVLSTIPQPVRDSLETLARRAHNRVEKTENYINQFREEVALWFDRSMARSSGVYKRNAKGVAILIGLLLAAITNSDSFFMAERLSNDENLRRVITDRASQISAANTGAIASQQDLERLKSATDAVLRDLDLPIGWDPPNLLRQFGCKAVTGSTPNSPRSGPLSREEEWNNLRQACLSESQVPSNLPVTLQLILAKPLEFLRRIAGWLVTGIAISMGAPFWFDLLGKVMNVRNTGSKPASPANSETAK